MKCLIRVVVLGMFWALPALLCMEIAVGQSKVFESNDMLASLGKGDKAAILMVYFGTTHDDARAKVFDAATARVRASFPGIEVREAYTARIVIKRLADRGLHVQDPREALLSLKKDGYTHVIVHSTSIIAGLEWEATGRDVQAVEHLFKEIRLTPPLLFYYEDYLEFARMLAHEYSDNRVYMLVGHGTYDASTAQYVMLERVLAEQTRGSFILGCVEGYPFYEQALQRLKGQPGRAVTLVPLLLTYAEHGKNDIQREWRGLLEREGYRVTVTPRGMGELASVQELFVKRVRFYLQNRRLDIMEKKALYRVTGEKLHAE